MVPGAGAAMEPVQRTEKLSPETPGAGEAPFQSKSIEPSTRSRTGLPAKPFPEKYSAFNPGLVAPSTLDAKTVGGTATGIPSTCGDPCAYRTFPCRRRSSASSGVTGCDAVAL